MAGELQFYGDTETQTGLTVTASVYNPDGTVLQAGIACAETATNAIYIGDMPTAGSGVYGVRFFEGTSVLGTCKIIWDGTQEVVPGLTPIEGDLTDQEALRIILAALVGKVEGAGTHRMTFRDTTDTKDRITASVDTDGNRKAVELDAS